MMRSLLKNWNLARMIRMAIGVWAIIAAFQTKEVVLGLTGSLLVVMALKNIGCCGVRGCTAQRQDKNSSQAPEEINYEEIIQK